MDASVRKSKVSMMAVKSTTQARSMANVATKSMSRIKVRKQSYGFSGVAGIAPVGGRSSQSGLEFKRPALIFLNTYQLDSHFKFSVPAVRKVIDHVLDEYFTEHKYNLQESPAATMLIAGEILRDVKALGFNRYRILSVVTMGQKRSQCYNNAVAFLWDHERDNYVNTHREVTSAFIQVTVFGVYLD
ncbi:tctex1 domain-containing protein 1-like [Trichoplusia ni]|uniref:Tctex1 domain-containing protein 1-like n=1 Tax=Trichoplusia ni TaxID=7111 RepID=A0A7E5WR63_TRINI|nr:tctex1 domain-containing protein 1-like [Trichoplusia ni]